MRWLAVLTFVGCVGCVGSSETKVYENPEQTPFTQALLDCEAGEQGHRCMSAAEMLERGEGTQADRESACGYYGRACDMSFTPGCTAHAKCLEEGIGDTATIEAAKDRYLTACNRGDRKACVVLLDMLEKGRPGMDPDPEGVRNLLTRGCEVGDAEACARLETLPVQTLPGASEPAAVEPGLGG